VYLDAVAYTLGDNRKQYRLLSSLLRGAAFLSRKQSTLVTRGEISQTSTPEEVGRYYRGPELTDFWHYFVDMTKTFREASRIKVSAEIPQIETIDLTCGNSIMPAVAYSFHPKWRGLMWGRKSMYGKNPWHLPFV
jgi:hypothetical protein